MYTYIYIYILPLLAKVKKERGEITILVLAEGLLA
jgi:hypothetical protein